MSVHTFFCGAIPGSVPDEVKKLSDKELTILPSSIVQDPVFLDAINDKQRDSLVSAANRTLTEKNLVKKSYAKEVLKDVFTAAGRGAAGAAAVRGHARFGNISTAQFSKLDLEILEQLADDIPTAVLDKIIKEDELNSTEIKRLGTAMTASIAAGTASASVRNYMAPRSVKGDLYR